MEPREFERWLYRAVVLQIERRRVLRFKSGIAAVMDPDVDPQPDATILASVYTNSIDGQGDCRVTANSFAWTVGSLKESALALLSSRSSYFSAPS